MDILQKSDYCFCVDVVFAYLCYKEQSVYKYSAKNYYELFEI